MRARHALVEHLDPEQVAHRRLPMHVPLPPGGARERCSLDGTWRFRLVERPDLVEPDWVGDAPTARARSTAGRDWTDIRVPGNWTVPGSFPQGGAPDDHPHYTNVQMPFDGPPPSLPSRVPTGVYRRALDVPRRWRGRRIVLHIGGAESVHWVYVNGTWCGYGTDSRLPSEYDITDQVHDGANDLCVVVARYSAQSYVEDQDQWWMAGLHREVFVEARRGAHLVDVQCDADIDTTAGGATGHLVVRTSVDWCAGARAGHAVRLTVTDDAGRIVSTGPARAVPHRYGVPYGFTGHTVEHRLEIRRVRPWSAESPTRYVVAADHVAPDGRVVDSAAHHIGFRRVEVRDRQLLVNGRPIWVFGINRHDHHPERGKAVTVDDMRVDLLAMRRHNITAVRTSHYPNDHRFYDLCDELGLYVVDEANIESHAYDTVLCDDPRFLATWLARGSRMVQRDRNHPSIIVWSLGNESGYGRHHDALAGWIRHADPSRPLHYEGAVAHAGWDAGQAATDIVCPMYPTVESIRTFGASGVGNRPLVLCEYSHAMGNSNGSLGDYWDAITTTPGLQGGFIWEWKDHGITQVLDDGTTRYAHGGQFGDTPHDGNFVADGLVASDLTPHPAMHEVAWVYRPVTVALRRRDGASVLRVQNRQSFVDTAGVGATWRVLVDGRHAASGVLRLPRVAPGGSVDVAVPAAARRLVDRAPTGEAVLTVTFAQRHPTPWAPAGHIVATDQVVLRGPAAPARRAAPGRTAPAGDRLPRALAPLLVSEPVLTLWRAPVDNDGFKLMPELAERIRVGGLSLMRWQQQGLDRLDPEQLVHHRVRRAVSDDAVEYRHTVTVPDGLTDLPRIGVRLEVPASLTTMQWYGRGPHENYPDRARSAHLGRWVAPLDEPPYLIPQEFGLRCDCRWLELLGPRGRRLRIDVLDPVALHMSATRYSARTLTDCPHESALRPDDTVEVHLDIAHRGLGTASCGPDTLARYRVAAGTYRFAYRLSALRG